MKPFHVKGPYSMTFHLDVDETVMAANETEAVMLVTEGLSPGAGHISDCKWEGDSPVVTGEGHYRFIIGVDVKATTLMKAYSALFHQMKKLDNEAFQWESTNEVYDPEGEDIDLDVLQDARINVFHDIDGAAYPRCWGQQFSKTKDCKGCTVRYSCKFESENS